jgi:hypothetical protein
MTFHNGHTNSIEYLFSMKMLHETLFTSVENVSRTI